MKNNTLQLKKILKEFGKEFVEFHTDTEPTFIDPNGAVGPIMKWLSEALIQSFIEGQKNGKAAYKGQLKREWYQQGFKEGRKSVLTEMRSVKLISNSQERKQKEKNHG